MRLPTPARRPRKSQLHRFPAPTAGLISNRALALAEDGPPGAAVMQNFFPTPTGCVLRRGLVERADVGARVTRLFSYSDGENKRLYAATETEIFDIAGAAPVSVLDGQSSGEWSTAQFATAGGTFLIGVNGADDAFLYDGASFGPASITFPDGSGLDTRNLAFVWVYRQRLWFVQRDTMDAWYLPVDSIGGELTLWPMGGVFTDGGTLQWGQGWSLDSGSAGGLSEQCVFVSSTGQVAVYQGLSPDPDGSGTANWAQVGTYQIGRPMGPRAFTRAGGDLLIATSVGLVSLASAARLDRAALGQHAVSYPINTTWAELVRLRGLDGWQCEIWAEGQMLVVIPPRLLGGQENVVLVANTNTGAWAEFTGWFGDAIHTFDGGLYLGLRTGVVARCWSGGNDLGMPYVARVAPLFSDGGAPASRKFPKLARATYLATTKAHENLTPLYDYRVEFDAPPNASVVDVPGLWGTGKWGETTWGETPSRRMFATWRGVRGTGNVFSLGVQISATEAVPNDIELVSLEMMYQTGDMVT